MLLFFIFAALGVELFGDLSKGTRTTHTGKPDKAETKIHTYTFHSVHAQVFIAALCDFNLSGVNSFFRNTLLIALTDV